LVPTVKITKKLITSRKGAIARFGSATDVTKEYYLLRYTNANMQ